MNRGIHYRINHTMPKPHSNNTFASTVMGGSEATPQLGKSNLNPNSGIGCCMCIATQCSTQAICAKAQPTLEAMVMEPGKIT